MKPTQVVVIDLGPNNVGSFGPKGYSPDECERFAEKVVAPEYSRPVTKRWRCVDGRPNQEELLAIQYGAEVEEVAAQTAGSLPVTEAAADYMNPNEEHEPMSVMLAKNTSQAVADEQEVTVHGDNTKGKAGCRANADVRGVLHFNAANSDIVVAKSWAVVQALKLDEYVGQDDLVRFVLEGEKSANNDALWDVTAEGAVDIMVANGAQYEELQGEHCEHAEGVDLTPDQGLDKVSYIREQSTEEGAVHAFYATMGRYKEMKLERAAMHGRSEKSAALETARAILFNIGASKVLQTDESRVALKMPVQ